MRQRPISAIALVMTVVAGHSLRAAELTVEERAAGIAAVERLRQSWRTGGAAAEFDRRYPSAVWIDRSVDLGEVLSRMAATVTPEELAAALDSELDRMTASSRAPGRLAALRAALDEEPARLRECLALPRVAHRLDGLLASGELPEIHVPARSRSWEWWISPLAFDARQFHTAVWTGNEMIVWGGRAGDELDTGGLYEPATDSWLPTSLVDAPGARSSHTAVWADGIMIVWGGYDGSYLDDGSRFDPVTNSWLGMADAGAPPPRAYHTAVWTDNEMVVWGGGDTSSPRGDGGRYDPVGDEWLGVTMTDAPWPRYDHVMVWTGSEAIVWGGATSYALPPNMTNTGGRYDPVMDSWTATSTTGDCPTPRYAHVAVWTGDEMIVWADQSAHDTGGRYDPAADSWLSTSTADAPEGRAYPSAVWTGDEMIIWGGSASGPSGLDTGGHYHPAADSWTPTALAGAPEPSNWHTAVWTGSEMLVWGGYDTNQLAGYGDNLLVFEDGFESGDTSAWSAVIP
jgi:hypothetical protein